MVTDNKIIRVVFQYKTVCLCKGVLIIQVKQLWVPRARHLFFPQLGSRTTIKKYGLVRNRNLLGHDDNILPFSIKKLRRTVYLHIQFLFQDYCVWSTMSYNKSRVFFFRSCVFYFCLFWRHRDQEYISRDIKCITLNILIQNVERSRIYSLYSAHVMSYHCCMFTEHYHFNIFGIEWDRNIIIRVISDHLSHTQGRWLVYISFTKLKRRPNGHVTAATAHYYVSRAATLALGIYLVYYHLLTQAMMPILNWLEEQIKLLSCLNHSTQHNHPKYSKSN